MWQDKGKGFRPPRVANFGKVNIWGKLMEDKSHFNKVCLCRSISVLVPTFHFLYGHKTFPGEGIYGSPHFSEVSAFSQIKGARGGFCISWFSISFNSKWTLCKSGIFLSGIFWSPFSSYPLSLFSCFIFFRALEIYLCIYFSVYGEFFILHFRLWMPKFLSPPGMAHVRCFTNFKNK